MQKVAADCGYRSPEQVEWINAFYAVFRDLAEYVKQTFPNGIPWNPKGVSASEAARTTSTSDPTTAAPPPGAAGGLPPPPPPPPPPGPPPVLQAKGQQAPGEPPAGFNAVFTELNQGENVTKGLRKVDKSEMTHKNPALRGSSTVSERDSSVRGKSPMPGKKPKPESMRAKKPPKMELQGKQWTIVSISAQLPGIGLRLPRR